MSMAEELSGNDIRIGLNQGEILAVETILEPVQRLPSIMPLVTYFSTKKKEKKVKGLQKSIIEMTRETSRDVMSIL